MTRSRRIPGCVVSLALITLATSARADVLVVAPSGAPYLQIAAAVGAAQNGDTILVRPGSYTGFTIDDKSVAIVADGASVQVTGTVSIASIAAARDVILAGLTLQGPPHSVSNLESNPTAGAALSVSNCAGSVRVEFCSLRGGQGHAECMGVSDPGGRGAYVLGSPDVVFEGCQIRGANGHNSNLCWMGTGGRGGEGLGSTGSMVALYDCALFGGDGGSQGGGGNGGHAARMRGAGGAFVSNSTFVGGRGGRGNTCDDPYAPPYMGSGNGGSGGNGLVVEAPAAVQLLGETTTGGIAGAATCGGDLGYPGVGLADLSIGHVFHFNVPARSLAIATPVRESTTVTLTITGVPGDLAFLAAARGTAFQPVPSWRGVALTESSGPTKSMILGEIPASGVLTIAIPIPDQGPGFSARTLHLQAWVRDAASTVVLGSYAAVTVLDSSY